MLIGTGPEDNIKGLQKTQLGWIIGGNVPTAMTSTARKAFVANLDFDLQQFWKVEEGPREQHSSSEEREYEDFVVKTVRRDISGR